MKCKDRLKEEVKKMKDRKCGQIVKRKKGMSRQKDVEKDRQIDRQIDIGKDIEKRKGERTK